MLQTSLRWLLTCHRQAWRSWHHRRHNKPQDAASDPFGRQQAQREWNGQLRQTDFRATSRHVQQFDALSMATRDGGSTLALCGASPERSKARFTQVTLQPSLGIQENLLEQMHVIVPATRCPPVFPQRRYIQRASEQTQGKTKRTGPSGSRRSGHKSNITTRTCRRRPINTRVQRHSGALATTRTWRRVRDATCIIMTSRLRRTNDQMTAHDNGPKVVFAMDKHTGTPE